MQKTFFIQSLGCAKNKCDADKIAQLLLQKGLVKCSSATKADVVVINTCGFISTSRQESIEEFFNLYKIKKKSAKIIFAGCMAQRYYDELSSELKEADYILGNWDIAQVENIIDDMKAQSGTKVFGVGKQTSALNPCDSVHKIYPSSSLSGPSCYIKIAEGCTHRCSFCAIPIIRGTLVSLDEESIIQSAKNAISQGAIELNLVAQDLINYGKDRGGRTALYSLLDRLCALEGDFVIRMLYIHPDFFEKEILDVVKSSKGKILPYYDIPIQHVSPAVLSAMGRKGDVDKYTELFEMIRSRDENSVIRSTFMLGFPTERDGDIELLEKFISKGLLDYTGFFTFSPEEGTRAFELGASEHNKSFYNKWIKKLSQLQEKCTDEHFSRFVSTSQRVIIEDVIDDESCIGRIWVQAPEVDGITTVYSKSPHKKGDVINATIISNDAYDFTAREI